MYQITQLTDDALQTQTLILPADGSQIGLTIYFRPMQFGWFITSLTHGSFQLNGMRIVNSPNMLLQWKNQIPFGLACFSNSDREPTQQQDFSSRASTLYILTAEEVEEYSEFLGGG